MSVFILNQSISVLTQRNIVNWQTDRKIEVHNVMGSAL